MAQPSTRQGLIDYAKRQLVSSAGDHVIDDSPMLWMMHYNIFTKGILIYVYPTFLKHLIPQDDIDRGRAPNTRLV